MKKYRFKEDCSITGKINTVLPKGTKVLSDGYVDEDGGIMCVVSSKSEYKGLKLICNISELEER